MGAEIHLTQMNERGDNGNKVTLLYESQLIARYGTGKKRSSSKPPCSTRREKSSSSSSGAGIGCGGMAGCGGIATVLRKREFL